MKRTYIIFFLFISFQLSFGQEVTIDISAPEYVRKGEEFRIKFTIDKKISDFTLDKTISDFTLIKGPATSLSTSYTVKDGEKSTKVNSIYSYSLVATKEGKNTLPCAEIKVDDISYRSRDCF